MAHIFICLPCVCCVVFNSVIFFKKKRVFLFQEIVDKDGQSKVLSFTVPSLSKPSVYHEVCSESVL